jgi:hypothetical protein
MSTTLSKTFSLTFGGSGLPATEKTAAKISSFAHLPRGWHYGKGVPAHPDTVRIATEYLLTLTALLFEETDAFPGADGEILVSAYRGKHCVEVTVETDRSFAVSHQLDGAERFHAAELSGINASLALLKIARDIEQEECGTSIWSTLNTMTTTLGGSIALPSKAQAMEAAHRSFWNNAELMIAVQSALTFNATTRGLAASHQSSGGSTIQYSTPIVGSNRSIPSWETGAITR